MKLRNVLLACVAATSIAASAEAVTYVYVGSWSPYDARAPQWFDPTFSPNGPLAYTAQEAAALLFGGNASSYAISTVDSNPLNINFQAHYDVIGYGASVFSQSYSNKYLGLYYGPQTGFPFGDPNAPASAFIRDNFVTGVNYAFQAVPEPATWAMMIVGFGLAGAAMRRRSGYATA